MRYPRILCSCLLLCFFLQAIDSFAQSDLELSISVDNETPFIYKNVVFTAALINKGPQVASNTVVNCPFPSDLAYVEHDAGDNFYNIGTRRWNIGSIGVGDTAFLELTLFTLSTDGSGVVWEVEFTDNPDPDSSPGNGNGATAMEDDEASQTINFADLELRLTASQTEVEVGDLVEFTLTVLNNGPNILRNPRGRLLLPESLQRSSSDGTPFPPSTFNSTIFWSAGQLRSGSVSSQVFHAIVQDISAPITLYTEYSEGFLQGDPDSSPGNGTPPIAVEDDEVAITLVPANGNNSPSVVLSTGRPNVNGPFDVRLVFSENVTGLETSDFQITNGQAVQVNGFQNTYTLQVSPIADGLVSIQLPASTVTDMDGNPNQASNIIEVNYLQANSNQIDLELSLSVDDPSLVLFQERVFTLEVKNKGGLDATNVAIAFKKPEALAAVRWSATTGFYSDWTGFWEINELMAGSSATLTFTVFIRDDSNDLDYYGQVSSVDQEDADSSPDNNPGPVPIEDDEVVEKLFTSGNGLTDLRLQASSREIALLPGQSDRFTLSLLNESAVDANDISIDFTLPTSLEVDNISSSTGIISNGNWSISSLGSGEEAFLFFDLSAGSYTPNNRSQFFAEVASASPEDDDSIPGNGNGSTANEDDEAISYFSVIPPNSCSIDQVAPIVFCDDNQTPINGDDTYTFKLEVEGSSLGNNYNLSGDLIQDNIAYNDGTSFGPFNIADGPLNLTLTDATIPACNTSIMVNPPAPCSSGSAGVDLRLSLSAAQEEFRIFDFLDYVLTLENEGDEDASGVVVRFDKPEGVGITSSSPSTGTFDQWLGQWSIGDLAAGQSVQLDLKYFVISEELSLAAFAEVMAQDQSDFDSTPNNNGGPSPTEDDEAALELYTENYLGNPNPYFAEYQIGTEVVAGSPTSYELRIGNDGGADLPAGTRLSIYFVRNFISPFDLVNPNPARLLEEITLDAIPQGGSVQISGSVDIDNLFNSVDRAFYLAFALDADNSVTEWKEDDNLLSLRVFRARTCQGNFVITNENQMRTFLEGCTTVDGSIRVQGRQVFSLFYLYALKEVKGAFQVQSTSIRNLFGLQSLQTVDSTCFIFDNQELRTLNGLTNLLEAQNLGVSSNPLIDDLSAFRSVRRVNSLGIIGMQGLTDLQSLSGWSPAEFTNLALVSNENLASINGLSLDYTSLDFLTITENPLLASIDELSNLTEVGSLYFARLEQLNDLNALSNLENVGHLVLEFNEGLTSLEGLKNVGRMERITIVGNNGLQNLSGLDQLTEVEGNFTIAVNENLENLKGLENLSRVGGNFQIAQQAKIRNLDELANLTFVGRNFAVQGNDLLENLDGLSQLLSIGTENPTSGNAGFITANRILSDCCGLLPLLTVGTVNTNIVLDNASGCRSIRDVLTNCTQNRSSEFRAYYDYEGVLPYKVIQAYPNPVQDVLHLQIAAKADETELQISLHDLTGRKMGHWKELLSEGLNDLRVDTKTLPSGSYFLQLHTQGKQKGIPFVKTRD